MIKKKKSHIDRNVRNVNTSEIWEFKKEIIDKILLRNNIFYSILMRVTGTFRILFGLFLLSTITSIYIIMTIMCAPLFIYLLCN